MSTVVAVQKGNQIVIACDSLACAGPFKVSTRLTGDNGTTKIIQFDENSYIGFVGHAVNRLVVDDIFKDHPGILNLDSPNAIFKSYLKIHQILKDDYFLCPVEEDVSEYESSNLSALIACPKGIYDLSAWRDVTFFPYYWAIGSGSDFAMGSMYALYNRLDSAKDIAHAGVEAGAEFDIHSGLPIGQSYVINLKG
jgi:ATP-dependent protease HslVU (ClpYQ) peptidase subunit